jgi:hypothetical protein
VKRVTLGSLWVNDYLMDEDGDIYVVAIKKSYKRARAFGTAHYNFGLLCLTDPAEDITWVHAENKMLLGEEWVWHSRKGALV